MSRGRDPGPEQLGPEQKGSWQRGGTNLLRFDATRLRDKADPEEEAPEPPAFAEMAAATNYSFLRGASHPLDMVWQALHLGHAGIGIADRNTVAGVVRAWAALRDIRKDFKDDMEDETTRTSETPEKAELRRAMAKASLPIAEAFRLVVGARLCFADGTPDIIAYPANRHGWGRLTLLLSTGNRKEGVKKGDCDLRFEDLLDHAQDMLLIAMPTEEHESILSRLAKAVPGRLWLGVTMPRGGKDRRHLMRLAAMGRRLRLPLLATCDALYAKADDRALQDVVTCIREGVTLRGAGRILTANAERHLKPAREVERLFQDYPQAVTAWQNVLEQIEFDLGQLKYEYPHEPVPQGWQPQDWLEHETLRLAHEKYPDEIPEKVRILLKEEFELIRVRDYAYYF